MVVVPDPVRLTVWSGAVFVIVKLGYVPLVEMPVLAVRLTVWSGAELVIVIDPAPSVMVIPVPSVNVFFCHKDVDSL